MKREESSNMTFDEEDIEEPVGQDDELEVAVVPQDTRTPQQHADNAEEYFAAQIQIPDTGDYSFSWRKLWAFTGPAFLMSIAFLDPGNIEADLQSATIAQYKLLWLLVASTIAGLYIQILSARIGTVTGMHMAELCKRRFPKGPRIALWLLTEIAIIGSDMQEVIGTAISFYLLSNGKIPLYAGVVLTILDTFTFLFLDRYGLRKLEFFFVALITTMAGTFGYEFIVSNPEFKLIGIGLIYPYCAGCSSDALKQGVGIIGATIQPHNLYLHSALVKSRHVNRENAAEVKDANRYVAIESAVALFLSLIINIMVASVFARELFGKTNAKAIEICHTSEYNTSSILDPLVAFRGDPDAIVDADLYNAGVYLGCRFGIAALYIWAIGIFAAGQSSTMTGTYAGQFVMEGFLNLSWVRWKRVLLTRSLAIMPTLAIALSLNSIMDLTGMNDFLNALMSLMLPFALLPMIILSASEKVMGRFRTGRISQTILWILSAALIVINVFFIGTFVSDSLPHTWWVYLLLAIVSVLYGLFITYLVGCLLVVLGFQRLVNLPWIGPLMRDDYEGLIALAGSSKT